MNEQINIPRTCTNGHQVHDIEAKFCIFCRAPLNVVIPTVQVATPIAPAAPAPAPPAQIVPPPAPQSPFQQPTPIPPPVAAAQAQNQQYPNPAMQPNYYPPQPNYSPQLYQMPHVNQCKTCGGNGRLFENQTIICQECGWLRPLAEGYGVDCSAFQWSEDGKAMRALRSITPLTMAAEAISDKVGRRWIESTFNSVLLSEKQLPEVYEQAVRAARILGMSYMPDVYISGELMWDCKTFGSDRDAFIVMGTALATNFRGPDLLFLFAREIGHCRTGHALWQTVIKFLMGEQGRRNGLMGGGLFAALIPSALLEGAIETPLLAWARQSEITADRAGMLAVGDEEVARRVLLSWTLKSSFLYKQINLQAWLEQQAAGEDDFSKVSELTTSSTPYIARRLRILSEFAQSPELKKWQEVIKKYIAVSSHGVDEKKNAPPAAAESLKTKCTFCGTMLSVPFKVLEGKEQLNVRCSNAQCGKVIVIKKKPAAAAASPAPPPAPPVATAPAPTQDAPVQPTQPQSVVSKNEEKREEKKAQTEKKDNDIKAKCPTCGVGFRIPLKAFEGKQQINVRCPNAECGKVVTLKKKSNIASSDKKNPSKKPTTLERNLNYDDE
jgi:Zn-dependent protease with chaperone function